MGKLNVNLLILLCLALLYPTSLYSQWSAVQVASNTYNSVLRPMSQGVYDHHSDKSFLCFMQENSNPYVVECDHSIGHIWGDPQLVYTQPSASKYNFPTIDILPDRRLVMCYASPFDEALGFAISETPADASSWLTKTVPVGTKSHVEYPRIKVDRFGNIYLFFTHMNESYAAHKRWYYYVKSEDNGETWTEPILSIQRELDDPYGMCELYVGYTAEEPYRLGEPERWWFAYTSSSGFQFEGVHTGPDNSQNLIDSSQGWGDGANFYYRWLYNVTKGTNSGIDDANTTTVYPTSNMIWDNGDAYGIAYHNIYHSDIYVMYFRPDNGNWYDAAHNNLGTTVSRSEMETIIGRPYESPSPPASKDVGYVPVVTVNNQGYPTILEKGIYYSWNGTEWETISPSQSTNGYRFFWFADNNYYLATNGLSIYSSSTTSIWENVGSTTLPNSNRYSLYGVFINEGHAEALFNVHEYRNGMPGNAWGISAGETQIPQSIILRTSTPKISTNDTAIIHAYVTDNVHGARSRVRNASNQIHLSILNGNAHIINNSIIASEGSCDFKVVGVGNESEVITLKASSDGLEDYYIDLSLNEGVTNLSSVKPLIKDIKNPIYSIKQDNENILIFFKGKQDIYATITTPSGRKISSYYGRESLNISTKNLSKGIYFLNVKDKKNQNYSKTLLIN